MPPSTTDGWTEGHDGTVTVYRERLMPPWWLWVAGATFAAAVAVAYGYAWGTVVAVGAGAVVGIGLAALLIATSSVVTVDDRVVRAGRARLPLIWAGSVTELDRDAAAFARTRDYNPAAYSLLRTWSSGVAVRIEVTDPRDPHPYWLVTTRRPSALAAAIRAQAGQATRVE